MISSPITTTTTTPPPPIDFPERVYQDTLQPFDGGRYPEGRFLRVREATYERNILAFATGGPLDRIPSPIYLASEQIDDLIEQLCNYRGVRSPVRQPTVTRLNGGTGIQEDYIQPASISGTGLRDNYSTNYDEYLEEEVIEG